MMDIFVLEIMLRVTSTMELGIFTIMKPSVSLRGHGVWERRYVVLRHFQTVISMKGPTKIRNSRGRVCSIIPSRAKSTNMRVFVCYVYYLGFFVGGKKEGSGREDYPNGGFYEGFFRDNLKHG
jgi:hypothetical protein